MNNNNNNYLLSLCDNCGCARYPFCNINGAICNKCTHHHHLPNIQKTKKGGGIYREIKVAENGDCLFECIMTAFRGLISIEELRNIVASKQTRETFRAYKQLQNEEFPYMKGLTKLSDFKAFVRKRGKYFGPKQCYWGDENALTILADSLKICFAIYGDSDNKLIKKQQIGLATNPIIMLHHMEDHYTLVIGPPQEIDCKIT